MAAKYTLEHAVLVLVILLILPAAYLYGLGEIQWDFSVYYWSAKSFVDTLNPYDRQYINDLAGKSTYPYVYPIPSILVFVPFTLLPLTAAQVAYLALKLLVTYLVVRLWQKHMVKDDSDVFFIIFFMLGYNTTVLRDIFAGNVSMFEQLILWTAFYYYVKGDNMRFTAGVLLSSMFKVTSIAFLALNLIHSPKKNIKKTAAAGLAFTLYWLIPLLSGQAIRQGFISNFRYSATLGFERGLINPAMLPFVADWVNAASKASGIILPYALSAVVYAAISLSILCISAKKLRRLDLELESHRLAAVMFSVMAYCITVPRIKDYSYVIAIPATYFILTKKPYSRLFPHTLLPMYFFNPMMATPEDFPVFLLGYMDLFYAAIVWLMYLRWKPDG